MLPLNQPSKFTYIKKVLESWRHFLVEIFRRLLDIPAKPNAVLYTLVVIIAIGGLGTWTTCIMYQYGTASAQELLLSILTYIIAITATGVADAVMDPGATTTTRLMVITGGLAALYPLIADSIPFIFKNITPQINTSQLAYWTVPAWAVWLFANITDSKFNNPTSPAAAAGGDPLQPL